MNPLKTQNLFGEKFWKNIFSVIIIFKSAKFSSTLAKTGKFYMILAN